MLPSRLSTTVVSIAVVGMAVDVAAASTAITGDTAL